MAPCLFGGVRSAFVVVVERVLRGSHRAFPPFSAHQTPMSPCVLVAPAHADPSSPRRPVSVSLPQVSSSPDMKDIAVSSSRQSRNSLIYPKKRPSPHGVQKVSKSPSLLASYARRSPRSAKLALLQQQQRLREAQYCRKESVLLEEEYRDEIRYYMHDMEVSFKSRFRARQC